MFISRACTKDYVYDDGDKVKFKVEKGAIIFFPTYSIHRHPECFPDPEQFNPERFNDENKHKIRPETYIPFGSGSRNCIVSIFQIGSIISTKIFIDIIFSGLTICADGNQSNTL